MNRVISPVPPALRLRFGLLTVSMLLATGAAYQALSTVASASRERWLALALVTLIVQLTILWRVLPQNRAAEGEAIRPNFGPANGMTLIRGLLVAWLAGFLLSPPPTDALAWIPALLFTAAGLLDVFDGVVARLSGHATRLGATLDLEYDAMSIIIVNVLVVQWGQLPVWFLLVGLARYLFVVGLWWRQRRGLPVYELTPSTERRAQAGLMWGMLSVLLWPVFAPPATTVAGILFGLPFGTIFLRDWLVCSGRIDPQNERYRAVRGLVKRVAQRWVPLVARAALVGLLLFGAVAPDWRSPLTWLGGAGVAFVAVGLFGRIAALCATAFITFAGVASGYSSADLLFLAAALAVATLGTGPLTLWTPENRLWDRRFG